MKIITNEGITKLMNGINIYLIVHKKCQSTTSNGSKPVGLIIKAIDYIPRNNMYLRDLPRNHL